ncbi:MAG TPA: hypothetical protein VG455_04270 [Acidimicrobiales bacterium]|nr:hypothetical protein [Acidimicrobiales bacterium]
MTTYTADVGERQIVAQRVDAHVRLYDEPAAQGGRRWIIESEIGSKAELEAIVADYVAKAKKIGYVPTCRWF